METTKWINTACTFWNDSPSAKSLPLTLLFGNVSNKLVPDTYNKKYIRQRKSTKSFSGLCLTSVHRLASVAAARPCQRLAGLFGAQIHKNNQILLSCIFVGYRFTSVSTVRPWQPLSCCRLAASTVCSNCFALTSEFLFVTDVYAHSFHAMITKTGKKKLRTLW